VSFGNFWTVCSFLKFPLLPTFPSIWLVQLVYVFKDFGHSNAVHQKAYYTVLAFIILKTALMCVFQVADILQKDPDMRPDVENLLNERLPKVFIITAPLSFIRSKDF